MTRKLVPSLFILALAGAAVYPALDRRIEAGRLRERLARAEESLETSDAGGGRGCGGQVAGFSPDLSLFLRVGERARALGPALASWQTIGGCGAGSATGAGAGVKWVGRGVT